LSFNGGESLSYPQIIFIIHHQIYHMKDYLSVAVLKWFYY